LGVFFEEIMKMSNLGKTQSTGNFISDLIPLVVHH